MMHPPVGQFVVLPEKLDHPPMNQMICFLDKTRGCGPDCLSYSINAHSSDYNEPWGHCVVVASMFRIGKHLVVLAQQGDAQLSIQRTTVADNTRASNAPTVPSFVPPTSGKAET